MSRFSTRGVPARERATASIQIVINSKLRKEIDEAKIAIDKNKQVSHIQSIYSNEKILLRMIESLGKVHDADGRNYCLLIFIPVGPSSLQGLNLRLPLHGGPRGKADCELIRRSLRAV